MYVCIVTFIYINNYYLQLIPVPQVPDVISFNASIALLPWPWALQLIQMLTRLGGITLFVTYTINIVNV